MGRYSQLDTDEERLPHGVKRVGYDADSETYSYRDSLGLKYEGAPGAQYGHLQRVGNAPAAPSTNPFRTGSQSSRASDEPPKYLKERYEYLADEKRQPEARSPPTTFSQIFENAQADAALPVQHNKDIEEKVSRTRSIRPRQRRDVEHAAPQQLPKRRQTVKKLFQACVEPVIVATEQGRG